MTQRFVVMACLVMVVLGCHTNAEALGWRDVWDTLDSLSGPGPFSGAQVATGKINCWENGELKVKVLNPDRNDPCLYFELRYLQVDPDGTYQKVTATLAGAGVSFELLKVFEVGASVGLAYFSTEVGNSKYHVVNPTLSPRLVFKPLRLVPKWRENRRAGFLQMHYRPTIRFGHIDGSDFGVPAGTFSADTEFLNGGSLIVIDVLEALRPSR
jgi:hypothetical protein